MQLMTNHVTPIALSAFLSSRHVEHSQSTVTSIDIVCASAGTEFQGDKGAYVPQLLDKGDTMCFVPSIFCDKDNVVVQIWWLHDW